MQIIIFLLEVVMIGFLLDVELLSLKSTEEPKAQYSCYSTFNSIGENVLELKDLTEAQKISAWTNSRLKEEMLQEFPHLEKMSLLINNRIKDDLIFKDRLIEYMENIHGQYLAQDITYEEFRRALVNPDPTLPAF